jgi:uncharacterized protein YndB with AHSA1/START domain
MTEQTTQRSSEHATFTIERTYPAAPARVYAAWAEPEAKASWFGPPTSDGRELDFRVGGAERFLAGGQDGTTYTYDARYHEIVPERRIVYAYTLDRDQTRISASLVTVEIEPAEQGARLLYTEQAVYLDGGDTPAQREHGTRELLEKLEQTLQLGEAPARR